MDGSAESLKVSTDARDKCDQVSEFDSVQCGWMFLPKFYKCLAGRLH